MNGIEAQRQLAVFARAHSIRRYGAPGTLASLNKLVGMKYEEANQQEAGRTCDPPSAILESFLVNDSECNIPFANQGFFFCGAGLAVVCVGAGAAFAGVPALQ